jgi:UDP-glucose 6-dehydrogenase
VNANEKPPIGVVGVGWVGLVTAACFADVGHPVVAMDIDEAKVETLSSGGTLPIHEPGLLELVDQNRERLRFTTGMTEVLDHCRLLFCCVDTPPTYSGDADLSRVEAVVRALPEDSEHALVMKSTVPAGTGVAIRRSRPGLVYVSCPEFLKEGTAVTDFLEPDRVVIGADEGSEWAAEMVADAYRPLGGELVMTDVASAEMIKLASNAFLATKISFINEIANVCEAVGADVREVARGMGLDARIGPKFLQAGIGYGGSCFAPEERISVRGDREPAELSMHALWEFAGGDARIDAVAPEGLEAWSWVPGEEEPEWMPIKVLTRRAYEGEMVEVCVSGHESLRVTADHPFVTCDPRDERVLTLELACQLRRGSLLPAVENEIADAYRPQFQPRSTIAPPRVRSRRVARVRRYRATGFVYSLEVPGSNTVIVNDGLVVHNCFPKDTQALKQLAGNTGYHFQLLTAVIEVNELQKRRVISKLTKHLGSLAGKRVALLGLAFKPNTDDMREASSLVLASRLRGEGASVTAYDPVAEARAGELLPNVELSETAADALDGADAAVLVTEWPEFAELDWDGLAGRMATPLIVDGRNFLDPERLRGAGFTYEGIGRAAEAARARTPG